MPSKRGKSTRRRHAYRKPEPTHGTRTRGHHRCAHCGKWCYSSRREADRAAGALHPGATVRFYECHGWWHFTSIPAAAEARIRESRTVRPEETPEPACCTSCAPPVMTTEETLVTTTQSDDGTFGKPPCTCTVSKVVNGHKTWLCDPECPVHGENAG